MVVEELITPNGREDWLSTFFEMSLMVYALHHDHENDDNLVSRSVSEFGHGGLYDVTAELTDKFEKENEDVAWGEDKDYMDTLNEFFNRVSK